WLSGTLRISCNLFDSHQMDEIRKHDSDNNNNNLARLFKCESYSALSSLLLSNAGTGWFDESSLRYLQQHHEVYREAVRRYSQQHRQVHRDAVRRFDELHPEVHMDAVHRYDQQHPEVHRKAVHRYDTQNTDARCKRLQAELRHLRNSLARLIVAHGPMAHWKGLLLFNINAYKLNKTFLWNDDVFICSHCQAPLFEEEEERRKWCCGEGAYNVTKLPSLNAPFNRCFLDRARAKSDLFALCALEISGGYRHPSDLSSFKIEGRMYHQVYSLDAPGQRFITKGGDVQLVNRCRLYTKNAGT
ncbi:hypothetical protein J6590_095615, partial [Homalodisca vitripennis]